MKGILSPKILSAKEWGYCQFHVHCLFAFEWQGDARFTQRSKIPCNNSTVQGTHQYPLCGSWNFAFLAEHPKSRRESDEKMLIPSFLFFE